MTGLGHKLNYVLNTFVKRTPAPPAFVFRNWETKFKFFNTFDRGFSTTDKLFTLGKLLKVVHGGKEFSNVHSNQDFPKTGDHS